jgi:flavin-dependent dehydrogenase
LSTNFDSIVAGGGPSGAAAAIVCQSRGLRTLLLESAATDKTRELPGETLHPGMETLFHSLGVDLQVNAAAFIRHPGYFVRSQTCSVFEPYGADYRKKWLGYQANRATLQTILANRARDCGVLVLSAETALRPVVSADRVAGIVTSKATYQAPFIVDACGGGHWLARHLHLPSRKLSPRLYARFGWVKRREDDKGGSTVPEYSSGDAAWEWTAPVGSGVYAWVRLDLQGRQLSGGWDPPASLAGDKPIGKARARDVTWRTVLQAAGPGYFLVGDAAWLLDPASSHGVLKAIESGMVAAEAIVRSLDGSAKAAQQQAGYCAWMADWFSRDAAALIALYSTMENPPSWLAAASEALRNIATSPWARASSTRVTNT